jgi:NADPH:quinone reductase-like Zn-dependent oxidoreductase
MQSIDESVPPRRLQSLDDLRLKEVDDPRPGRGELLVRVHAVSLNNRAIAL